MRLKSFLIAVVTCAALAAAAGLSAAPKKSVDRIWTHPEFARFGVERIALLPIATFDNSLDAEKTIEQAFGQTFKPTGHRWISALNVRDQLRARAGGGDSLVRVIKAALLKSERVDSLEAGRLCALLRVDAVMGLRADQWERTELDWNQSGKPYTQVLLRGALVDSSGTLLWSASGSQRGEGSYQDPSSGVSGVSSSGLDTKPIKAQAGAPTYLETTLPLFVRWVAEFPARATADSSAAH